MDTIDIVWSEDEPTVREMSLFNKYSGTGDVESLCDLMERRSRGVVTKLTLMDGPMSYLTSLMQPMYDGLRTGLRSHLHSMVDQNMGGPQTPIPPAFRQMFEGSS